MILKGYDLDNDCLKVTVEADTLYLALKTVDGNQMLLLIISSDDPDYLTAINWAITNGLLH